MMLLRLEPICSKKKKTVIVEKMCCLCGIEDESAFHIFTACHWVEVFWFDSSFQWDVRHDHSDNLKDWISKKIQLLINSGSDCDERVSLSFTIFGLFGCVEMLLCSLNFGMSPRITLFRILAVQLCLWLKFNADAAVDLQKGRAVVAAVVRDSSGALLTGVKKNFCCNSVVHAEAVAMLEAIRLAI